MENKDVFAAVCYMTLMEHHGAGLIEAHPSYIAEKSTMLKMGWEAFAMLDIRNKEAVMGWCDAWKFIPDGKVLLNYQVEKQAYEELHAKGFDL